MTIHSVTPDALTQAQASIRFRKDGVPAGKQPPLTRILGRCVEVDSGCWEFQGHRVGDYGAARYHGRMRHAHRIVYIELYGAIPSGLVVCHACDNPPCCNPDHLWLGTVADNNRDREAKGRSANNLIPGCASAALRARTHCNRGHEFSTENSYISPSGGGRRCRTCMRATERRRVRGAAA